MKNIYLFSLSSLAIISSVAVANQDVYVPTLEGGLTASVGTWYATPSSDNTDYATTIESGDSNNVPATTTVHDITPGYEFGIEASLGYVFDDTANDIVLSYRGLNTSDTDSVEGTFLLPGPNGTGVMETNLGYELNTFDLMIGQFLNIGQNMQMHFAAGASYLELEQEQKNDFIAADTNVDPQAAESHYVHGKNEFRGWGPRLDIDARYDFGQGFGIVAGGAVAYFLGEQTFEGTSNNVSVGNTNTESDSHAVTNLRGNVGIDYVMFFEDDARSTLGLEVGYLADYYDIDFFSISSGQPLALLNTTFSGPYVNLKGAW